MTRALRADARRNRERILDVAAEVVAEQGTQASLRDIARRAGVGMGTLYRHFATRGELLEALLGGRFDRLAERAAALRDAHPPGEALAAWLGEFASGLGVYRGLAASLVATIEDDTTALHASCGRMRAAGADLLQRAQESGDVRPDVDETDVFALLGAVGSIADTAPSLAPRRDHLLRLVMDGLAARR
ncbi:TetR/AcrR family transcriptional regulator [Actinomadura violacea]|nr:TetR/AcrR family transcriptional regulator [Actinomadura violacea]